MNSYTAINSYRGLVNDSNNITNNGNRFFSLIRNLHVQKKFMLHFVILMIIIGIIIATIAGLILVIPSNKTSKNEDINAAGIDSMPVNETLKTKPISDIVATAIQDSNKPQSNTTPKAKSTTEIPTLQLPSYINIFSVKDLKKIKSSRNKTTIIVEKLVDEIDDQDPNKPLDSILITNADQVTSLNISGPVTEEWVQRLLIKFNKIKILTINIEQLCTGATVAKKETLKSIRLENIQIFHVINSDKCPSISSWIFKLEFPNINQLRISHADFKKATFKPLHSFVENNKKSLSSIIIYRCFFCSECHFEDIQYSNDIDIRIVKELFKC